MEINFQIQHEVKQKIILHPPTSASRPSGSRGSSSSRRRSTASAQPPSVRGCSSGEQKAAQVPADRSKSGARSCRSRRRSARRAWSRRSANSSAIGRSAVQRTPPASHGVGSTRGGSWPRGTDRNWSTAAFCNEASEASGQLWREISMSLPAEFKPFLCYKLHKSITIE